MQIKVTPHTITLNKTEIVNEGEYNINTCKFELSEEYTGLTNMAIFTNGTNTFKTMIVDNQCIIPYEVLEDEGTLMVGVYGYEADGETLVKRYSPTPVAFYVEKGSYALAQEGEQPSPSIIEQLQEEIEQNSNDIATLQESVSSINQELPSFAKKTEIPTKTSQLTNDSGFITQVDLPSKTSQLQNDSGFITKSVNDLENYTKTSDLSSVATSGSYSDLSGTPDLSVYATTQALGNETTNRENADIGLQGQIDAITSSSDVKDIVGTYQDLLNYDTQHLGNNDVIKVLQDSTHNDAMTYYRWLKDTSTWQYIGQEGPYYTKSEIDTTLQGYVEDSDLTDYVKNTDYATGSKGGVIKTGYSASIDSNGNIYAQNKSYTDYQSMSSNNFISKGTLENVLNARIGDINTALDTINGEVI